MGSPDGHSMAQWTEHRGYWSIAGEHYEVTIEPRPSYCDRGHWIAKVFPLSESGMLNFDSQDGWPRYYFDFTVAKSECGAWLALREANLEGERTHAL